MQARTTLAVPEQVATYTIRTRYVQYPYTIGTPIGTPCVHDPYTIALLVLLQRNTIPLSLSVAVGQWDLQG